MPFGEGRGSGEGVMQKMKPEPPASLATRLWKGFAELNCPFLK